MQVIPWMEVRVPGFQYLSSAEREAPMHFSLLWSYFEAVALNTNATAGEIIRWVRALEQQRRLNAAALDPALIYFRDRYVTNAQLNHLFDDLNFRPGDHRPLVEGVLLGTELDPAVGVTALFIIIYRLRNNYLHGLKWAYRLRDQLQNFQVANDALMVGMDM